MGDPQWVRVAFLYWKTLSFHRAMDLLKRMNDRRKELGVVADPSPRPEKGSKKISKVQKAKSFKPGTRQMRNFIIEEKPPKKVVVDHITGMAEDLCRDEED